MIDDRHFLTKTEYENEYNYTSVKLFLAIIAIAAIIAFI